MPTSSGASLLPAGAPQRNLIERLWRYLAILPIKWNDQARVQVATQALLAGLEAHLHALPMAWRFD